jgi:acetylornithine deacetylase/succinyl-diaminopimelate desuccinylase-like protein
MQAGTKTNVIPDRVVLEVDVRTLPGQAAGDVRDMLDEALGEVSARVDVEEIVEDPATASPMDTPLWDAIARVCERFYPASAPIPFTTAGATDARFFRRMGATAYGFGMFSRNMSFDQYAAMFHGDDERVDVDSLVMSADMWEELARAFVG